MLTRFPKKIKTKKVLAFVRNPEDGHYYFEIFFPKNSKHFELINGCYRGDNESLESGSNPDEIEKEILNIFIKMNK